MIKAELQKIKIDKDKKNVVVIGDSYDLTDVLEIYLYKRFNVIAAINEFDGMEKIGYFEPACILIKSTGNIEPVLSFIPKLSARRMRDIPVIVYSKEDYSSINEFNLKAAGVREVIKFPIACKDFMTVFQLCVRS